MAKNSVDVLVLGCGPAGLGAALRLSENGACSWAVLEAADHAAGLSASITDGAGFSWDLGGHVFFSNYPEFGQLMDRAVSGKMGQRNRRATVYYKGRWVDFPFQNHLDMLPEDDAGRCAKDLKKAPGGKPGQDFGSWSTDVYGRSLAEVFFHPFNVKLWQTPLDQMGSQWVGQRVAPPDPKDGAASWGPNNTYFYPEKGGCAEPFRRLAQSLDDRVKYGRCAETVDLENRRVICANGDVWGFEKLISTIPLNLLIQAIKPQPPEEVLEAATKLRHNQMWLVGLGYDQPTPEQAGSWMYFPESHWPFQRLTNMAAHSPGNLPGGDSSCQSAWLAEVPVRKRRKWRPEALVRMLHQALIDIGFNDSGAQPISTFTRFLPMAYPVPTLERDDALADIHCWLEENSILSRGRFGGWIYETGNMDHAVIMGQQAVDRFLEDKDEQLWIAQWQLMKP